MTRLYFPTSWNWISMHGPDAADFLHRLTTVNIRALEVGQGRLGCFLTAQGKIRAAFTLWRYGSEEFSFEIDPGQAGHFKQSLLTTIDQYTFAEKFTLTDPPAEQLQCAWILTSENHPALQGIASWTTQALDEEIRVCHHGASDFGTHWFSAWGRPERLKQWLERKFPEAQPISEQELDLLRIQNLSPRVDHELKPESNPLEIGLRASIAENKGCYPGQEVIEKIISLGSPARRLALVEGQGQAPALGAHALNLATPPAEVGEITSVCQTKEGHYVALAVLRKVHAKEGLEIKTSPQSGTARVIRLATYE